MAWKQERTISVDPFEVVVDYNEETEERRIGVYSGETLLALEFVQPLSIVINNLVLVAKSRAHQFPAQR